MSEIKYYMYKNENDYTSTTELAQGFKDLEKDFYGLKYSKCVGLDTLGAIKNRYQEDYAEEDGVRIYIGTNAKRKATDITFTFFFIDIKDDNGNVINDRRKTYDDFCEYISEGVIYYHDTARMKQAKLCLLDALKPTEDVFQGSIHYIAADFKFTNLWGKCKDININE